MDEIQGLPLRLQCRGIEPGQGREAAQYGDSRDGLKSGSIVGMGLPVQQDPQQRQVPAVEGLNREQSVVQGAQARACHKEHG